MRILIIGSDTKAVFDCFNDFASTRIEMLLVSHIDFPLDNEQISLVNFFRQARIAAKGLPEGHADAMIISWNAEKDSATALFALTTALKPFQTRIYLAITNPSINCALERAEGASTFDRIILQSSLTFFQSRIVTPRANAVQAVKLVLLRNRPFGLPIPLDVLNSEDFLRGVYARRDACIALHSFTSKDLNQSLLVSQRFRTQFATLKRTDCV